MLVLYETVPELPYLGIKLMSVDDPAPGEVGLTKVVSSNVQPSPLNPVNSELDVFC